MENACVAVLARAVDKSLHPTFGLHWIYLASALLIAAAALLKDQSASGRALLGQLFPRAVWLHRSALTDYRFFLLTLPAWSLLATPLFSAETQFLLQVHGAQPGAPSGAPASWLLTLVYTAVLVLAADLKHYWVHRGMHHVSVLWEFHKVHHSAEVLTPVTAYRAHPVEMLIQGATELAVTALVTAAFMGLSGPRLTAMTILGVNAGRFLFYIAGVNLQHSHIPLSYGRRAEHVFISPLQHQLHHSIEPCHYDINFGLKFALWDWIWGTLCCAQPGHRALRVGLEQGQEHYRTAWQLHVQPWRGCLRIARLRFRRRAPSVSVGLRAPTFNHWATRAGLAPLGASLRLRLGLAARARGRGAG